MINRILKKEFLDYKDIENFCFKNENFDITFFEFKFFSTTDSFFDIITLEVFGFLKKGRKIKKCELKFSYSLYETFSEKEFMRISRTIYDSLMGKKDFLSFSKDASTKIFIKNTLIDHINLVNFVNNEPIISIELKNRLRFEFVFNMEEKEKMNIPEVSNELKLFLSLN